MMAIKGSELIDPDDAGYYHLLSRYVRRTFLCGKVLETNKDYEYRRLWIENKILELAHYFSIVIFSYAVMQKSDCHFLFSLFILTFYSVNESLKLVFCCSLFRLICHNATTTPIVVPNVAKKEYSHKNSIITMFLYV